MGFFNFLEKKNNEPKKKNTGIKKHVMQVLNPKIAAAPIAISEYPEKSQYIWIPNATAPSIILKDSIPIGFEKMLDTRGPILSAKNIFFKNPKAIKVKPNFRFER